MMIRLALLMVLFAGSAAHAQEHRRSFAVFEAALWVDAHAKGVSRATFDLALRGLAPDPRVIAATKRQPEYGKPVGEYIHALVSKGRIQRGIRKAHEWERTFDAIERKFRVERWVLLSLWGMETDYGAAKDRWDVFRSLATLAYVSYRHPYFRNELIVAMRIMQDAHLLRDHMMSSWAGAMGQTQFMPSNYVDYAVDFSGDRRADIWTSVPDVLASTANYLHKWKWQYGVSWGFEVTLPKGFDTMQSRGSFEEWRKRGVQRADGKPLPRSGSGILLFPSGAQGPAFLVTPNFRVLKEYNNSDVYAIAVGHLADRLHGGAPIKAKWPTDDHPLSRDARIALQKKLAALGYHVNDFEGHVDFDLRDNIRAEQKKHGLVPDGNPTVVLLNRLGVTVR
jgi:lytic murein transglycosylase